LIEDLPPLARPLNDAEKDRARRLAARWGVDKIEESAPVSVVGSGPDLNKATQIGLRRAAELLSLSLAEVMNRATITGGIEIGRHPGVVQVTFLAPLAALEKAGLLPFVQEQYGIG
jgi:formamidase